MLEAHRHLLRVNRPAIVQDLLVEDVLSELRSKFIFDQDDSELIESETTSRRKAEQLLDLLPNKGYNAFECFYESLIDKYRHLAKLLERGISEDRDNDPNINGSVNNNVTNHGAMTEAHKELLTSNRVSIVEDLLVDDVLTQLISKLVFDNNDAELIRAEKTSKRQAEKLLDLLVKKGDEAFEHFASALADPYPYLAELLLDNEYMGRPRFPSVSGDIQEVVESKLLEGGVPKQPQVFTRRPRARHNLLTALRSLRDRDAWVVLHGMAGCGKTILAADALRNAALLEDVFPGGVVWQQVGPVDRPKLLMKMQNLCVRLDKDKHRPVPRNLEEARERLQSLFAHQYPRTLLVLDDLWSAHDARFFDIRARVLVTTRDVSIADRIEVKRCPVWVSEKLSSDQCLDILSQWTNKHKTELPREAYEIIEECNGHPLVLCIIGALLRDHPRRWHYYWTQLRNHKLSKLKSKFAYQYPDLSEAIAMSIENLSEDVRNKFRDFVMFDSSITVPFSVFCLLWDMETEEVEDIMVELVNKSLVKSISQSAENENAGYAIHNLQLNYLLENCEDIQARHEQLVVCYKKKCQGKFFNLHDDGYVHWNLIHHMIQAKQHEQAIHLLTDLAWVTKKLELCGPADLINDYISVYKEVEEEEKDEFKSLNDFYHFVRTNAHMFASYLTADVVQTALREPAGTDVYKQARREALKRSRKGGLYVDWCNKQSESAQSLEMTLKPHDGVVHCCVFSSDGQTVLSSSSDGTAKVWKAKSGKILHSLEDHEDAVISCAFNYDNTKVLTTSHDRSVKIWKLRAHYELKLTYKDHKQDVHCAAFSPTSTGKEVVSCSADSTIRVWDCETGITKVVCKGHSGVVQRCCFSPDARRIASASNDETVKIWDANTGECLVTTAKHDDFVSFCCFNQDGSLVFSSSTTSVRIWDSVSGESQGSLDIGVSVLAFSISPVENKIALALSDATVQLWDFDSKEQLNVYHGHKSWVLSVAFSADGTQLVSGSGDETIKVWPVDTLAFPKRVRLKKVFDVFFRDDQPLIAVADSQNRVKIFEGIQGQELSHSEAYKARISSCVFSLDGSQVAIGLQSGTIATLEVKTSQLTQMFDGHEGKVYSLVFNNSGFCLLSCSQDKTFMTWDCASGKRLLPNEQRHEDEVTVASFFDSDKRIVTASKDGTVKVWESLSGKLLFTCDHQSNEWVLSCVVSPDNKTIVAGSVNSIVKAWDAFTGKELFRISPHGDVVRSLSICDDNLIFASGSDDGSVELASLANGQSLCSCTSHSGAWVTDIVFAKDCDKLVTVGNNIQWHRTNGKLLQQFFIKGSHLRRVKTSPDFQTFVTVDDLGILYILKIIT